MEDRRNVVLAVAGLFSVLTWLTTGLRMYVRGYLRSNTWGKDDWFMLAATFWYLCELLYVLASCALKFSLLFFYLRVALQRWHIWTIRIMMAGAASFGAIYFLLITFQCRPINEFWNNRPASSKCLQRGPMLGMTYTMSTVNAIADWTIGILPFFIVWGLRMERRTKFLVAGILAFAAIGSTATVIRMAYIDSLMDSEDFLYSTTDIAIWSTVEPGIGITAGNIATLRPLVRKFLSGMGSNDSSDRAGRAPHRASGPPNRQDRRGYRRSLSPSDLIPTEHTGTTTTKIYAQQDKHDAMPDADATVFDDMSSMKNSVAKSSEAHLSNDRHIKQTITVEHAYEDPARPRLQDSFRNSFGGATSVSLEDLPVPTK
ncbi:hypothetical protein P153DRAFT_314200 [Dothidotthia symphoricarpi CBS 119687]|uniref:Rhodopsin domain-containing protein n=1 Tax=Dothidotthia symphoricarpi CBS 119687 TaxID=1392245 RepID=A0A6A6AGZ5_9PLEO|nr:uncharacterized protein P153DRAFT_314200 [Dothidotthia symphoricarpi CBS 119687]KAF2130375.1 hypothetical protein P153DRAFT_314200 [Dothidotthia symphoricarpi CBS 119687]